MFYKPALLLLVVVLLEALDDDEELNNPEVKFGSIGLRHHTLSPFIM